MGMLYWSVNYNNYNYFFFNLWGKKIKKKNYFIPYSSKASSEGTKLPRNKKCQVEVISKTNISETVLHKNRIK